MAKLTLRERFEAKFNHAADSACWIWLGTKSTPRRATTSGYGLIVVDGKYRFSHRIAWLLYRGEIPTGMQVLHKCDVPLCVNPDHLFLGTHAENMADKRAKGREVYPPSGQNHWKARLTADQAMEIRKRNRPTKEYARAYGISLSTVYDIQKNRSWSKVA